MMILNEKNENILMLNEELQWYIREYYKKKNELKILENRVFKNEANNNIRNLIRKKKTLREKNEKKDDSSNSKIIEKNEDKKK